MNGLQNQMRLEAQRVYGKSAKVRVGIVDGYDPSHYAVKVRIQPENILTGWMPLTSPWVGNGWGMYSPPSLGDMVDVHFQQDDPNSGFVVQKFFSTTVAPLAVPSGEYWVVHKSGSMVKFHNDGSVEFGANTTLRMTGKDVVIHATNSFRWDVNGHGQHWFPTYVDTWQIGEVAGTAHPITPPEIS
jgi:uncharacterized protein involved in type VI secretion and phage assembly